MNEKGRKIIALRKKGKTCGEIEKILNLPKSTVAWWLRGVKIPESVKKEILEKSRKKWRKNITDYNNVYASIRSEQARNKREAIKEKASKKIRNLSKADLRIIGSMLYWTEGNTKNRHMLRFANANPEMIKIMMHFFRKICCIPDEKIKARMHVYPNTDKNKATKFWKGVTKLPKKNFYKPQCQLSKASKQKRKTNSLPFGTLHLRVCGTEKTCEVKGWIRGIAKQF